MTAGTQLDARGREPVRINGLPLPRALTLAMDEQRWRCPAESHLRRVFRERPIQPRLYNLATMRGENRSWREERDPAYFGHLDDKTPPGDIDPSWSLILGVLGPHMPFALDYRLSRERPRVLYLHSGGDRWITIACAIEELLARLHLDAARDPLRHPG